MTSHVCAARYWMTSYGTACTWYISLSVVFRTRPRADTLNKCLLLAAKTTQIQSTDFIIRVKTLKGNVELEPWLREVWPGFQRCRVSVGYSCLILKIQSCSTSNRLWSVVAKTDSDTLLSFFLLSKNVFNILVKLTLKAPLKIQVKGIINIFPSKSEHNHFILQTNLHSDLHDFYISCDPSKNCAAIVTRPV